MLVIPDILKDYPTGAIDITVVCSSRAYLSSLISMPLLVKAMALEETPVVVSRVIPLAIKSVRTRYTSCSCLSRRIRLGIGLATPS